MVENLVGRLRKMIVGVIRKLLGILNGVTNELGADSGKS